MDAFELFGEYVQPDITDSKRLQLFHGSQHVIAAGAGSSVTLAGVVQLLCEAEPPGILAVAPVDNITKRVHAFLWVVIEPNPAPSLTIDQGDLFAGAQIFDCFSSFGRRHPVGDTTAISTPVEAEYQARFRRSSAVHERVDTKCAVCAHQACIAAFEKGEARPPHQRAIGEDPEVLVALIGACVHRGGEQTTALTGPATDVRVSGRWFFRNPPMDCGRRNAAFGRL